MTWIYAFPAWTVTVVAVAGCAAIAAALVLCARGVMRRNLSHNDVCGAVATVVGTILAVLLSFVLVADWQEYDQAAQTASNEAGAAQDLYATALLLPDPTRTRLTRLLGDYAATVVDSEWPLMRSGRESPGLDRLSVQITGALVDFRPKTSSQRALQGRAIGFATAIADLRQLRLFDNRQGIPAILWAGIGLLVAVTLAMCAFFHVRNLALHVAMSACVGAAIAVVVVLIAELDYPFRGDIQIPPTPWTHNGIRYWTGQ